jgi:uncharacterized protein (TIGR04255 family)
MAGMSEFVNPPIVELVFSAQFSPLIKLSAGHFGLFWKELGDDWTVPGDAPPIPDQFELFDRPRAAGVRLQFTSAPFPQRFTLGHTCKDRLVQIQSTRFCLNWRKRDQSYPSYTKLIGEFDEIFRRFTDFVDRERIGPVSVNQWELTYIDAFSKGEYWETPADWTSFLPGLFHELFQTDGMDIALEHRQAEWSYEIVPKRGRLHISAAAGRVEGDTRDAVLLTTTVRGPVGKEGAESLRAGLDLGHGIASEAFLRVVSPEAKKRWEVRP